MAAGLGLPAEKALEVALKKLHPTPRPLYVEPTVLRDDAPVKGESFPSGHAAIAWTAVALSSPHLPRPAVAALARVRCAVVVHWGVRVAHRGAPPH